MFKRIQHVAGSYRTQSRVGNFADRRALFDDDVEHPPLHGLFTLKAYVLKVAGIPQGVEVAFQPCCIVDITDLSKDSSLDRFGRNAAVSF